MADFMHETLMHVTVKVRFLPVLEFVQHKFIVLAPVSTHHNIADILIKQEVCWT